MTAFFSLYLTVHIHSHRIGVVDFINHRRVEQPEAPAVLKHLFHLVIVDFLLFVWLFACRAKRCEEERERERERENRERYT